MAQLVASVGAGAIAGALVAGALGWFFQGSKAPEPKLEPSSVAIRTVPEEVVVTKEVIVREQPNASPSLAQAPEVRLAPAETAPPRPTDAERAAEFETSFQDDAPADSAAYQRQTAIQTAFRDPEIVGSQLHSVECRASQCRLEATFDDVATSRDAIQKLFANADAKVKMAGSAPVQNVDKDGHLSVTIYLRAPEEVQEPTG